MKKLLVILGPTSTGKTDLGLNCAKKFNGELIACDSRQVYKKLDIGTGKLPSNFLPFAGAKLKGLDIGIGKLPGHKVRVEKGKGFWEMDGVKIWMYDVADTKNQYTVFDYVRDANRAIDEILKKGKLPIIVGGTGLYLKALLEGLPNLDIPINRSLRRRLEKLSKEELQKELQQISSDKWESLNGSDRQNPRRLIRAIELVSINDINTTAVGLMSTVGGKKLQTDMLKIGLTAPRKVLYQRIDKRVISRIDQGMIDEAKRLHKEGLSFERMRQLGLEYGVLADYLEGKITSIEELIKIMQGKIHGYARRQLTWFKKEEKVFWFDITEDGWQGRVESRVRSWYYSTHDKKN